MIIRKPFKFLIRHFKIINLILFILIGFVTYKCYRLLVLFKDFVTNNYIMRESNLVSRYIGFLLPLSLFIIIVISIVIYILFKSKDKDNKTYLALIIFYGVLFFLSYQTKAILDVYEFDVVETSAALMYRDLSRFIFYPNFIFLILVFLNFIGFDLRTFTFTNLQDDIDIAMEDDAEFEIGVPIEDYKVKRTFFRKIRELKYYIIENKLVFEIIGAIVGVVIFFIGLSLLLQANKSVRVSQSFNHSNFNIAIKDSIITNIDYAGNIIREGYYYLAVLAEVTNKSDTNQVLDTDNFWLDINGTIHYPILDRSGKFLDLGEPYFNEPIKPNTTHRYVLAYELSRGNIKSKYTIKILDTINYNDGVADPKYKKITIKPKMYNNINNNSSGDINSTISFKDTKLLDSSLKINSYTLTNIYTYSYNYCYKDECSEKKNAISTGANTKKTLLVLDDDLVMDPDSSYMTFKKISNFYTDFVTIEYTYNYGTKEYTNTSTVVDRSASNDISGNVVLEVDYNLTKAETITLIITIRNERYRIRLL